MTRDVPKSLCSCIDSLESLADDILLLKNRHGILVWKHGFDKAEKTCGLDLHIQRRIVEDAVNDINEWDYEKPGPDYGPNKGLLETTRRKMIPFSAEKGLDVASSQIKSEAITQVLKRCRGRV